MVDGVHLQVYWETLTQEQRDKFARTVLPLVKEFCVRYGARNCDQLQIREGLTRDMKSIL